MERMELEGGEVEEEGGKSSKKKKWEEREEDEYEKGKERPKLLSSLSRGNLAMRDEVAKRHGR
jgi:hypothetical protein